MHEWAQIIDAHESETQSGLTTWLECWSLDHLRAFDLEISGAAPLDIGHILLINHDAAKEEPAIHVLNFETVPTQLARHLMVTPVSFDPNDKRPFQTPEWRNEVEARDATYRKKLRALKATRSEIGELFSWCLGRDLIERIA